jgi:hypothetical protein
MRNFKICTPHQHFVESQIKENGMGLTCDMYLGKRKIYTEFLQLNLKEIHHLKYQGIDGRVQLKQNLKKKFGGKWNEMK